MNTEEVEGRIDKWLAEIRDTSNAIRNNPNASLQEISGYGDRWDAIYTEAFLAKMKATRIWQDAKALLDDGMRDEMTKRTRRQTDFSTGEERRATYETKNIVHLIESRKYERVVRQLDDLLRFLAAKQTWLKEKRFNLHHEEKKELHYSAKENFAVD